MELLISEEQLHTIIRKELAPSRLDIHDIKADISSLQNHVMAIDDRLDRLEVLVEGAYVKLDEIISLVS